MQNSDGNHLRHDRLDGKYKRICFGRIGTAVAVMVVVPAACSKTVLPVEEIVAISSSELDSGDTEQDIIVQVGYKTQ